jgi:hypothetical protein
LSLAKTPRRLNVIHVTCDTTSSYVIDLKCALDFGEGQAEIIKTLNQRCPEFTVTNNLGKADFVVVLDHEGGKGLLRHRNKIAIFNRNGDDIFSDSTRELGNAVKDACDAMTKAKK